MDLFLLKTKPLAEVKESAPNLEDDNFEMVLFDLFLGNINNMNYK